MSAFRQWAAGEKLIPQKITLREMREWAEFFAGHILEPWEVTILSHLDDVKIDFMMNPQGNTSVDSFDSRYGNEDG